MATKSPPVDSFLCLEPYRSLPCLVVRGRDEMPEAQRHLDHSTPREVELLYHVAADIADLDLEGAHEHRLHH